MQLYTYYRSTASFRVRIALAIKGLSCESIAVNLSPDHAEQHGAPYAAINPQQRVPALRVDATAPLIQSQAILEYLEERYPLPALLPRDLVERARVRGVAAVIASDVHPLHNVGVLQQLRRHGLGEAEVAQWIGHWISQGLACVESLIGDRDWCFGDEPGLADLFLIPQVFAAERFGVPLDGLPRIRRVAALAAGHPAFVQAHPRNQADCPA